MSITEKFQIQKIDNYRWQIPKGYKQGMRVPGLIYADEKMLPQILSDNAPEQVANVAFLPGIVNYSLAMPDIHWGYGAPIGGVAATDPESGGVVTPGLIGYDINCGVRLIRSNLTLPDVRPKIDKLIQALFNNVPCGVGKSGRIRLSRGQLEQLVKKGSRWAVENGYGEAEDLEYTEQRGCLTDADPSTLSPRALERGLPQAGTLGSGNHFTEVQLVEEVYDAAVAQVFGVFKGQITLMIHSGSRGFGYQVCDDSLRYLSGIPKRYGINLPDRQLVCAPLGSPEGERYLAEMSCAANYAWNNRQCLMHLARMTFEKVLGRGPNDLGMRLVYDVAHNIGKFEEYEINGKRKRLFVHRKGATRAFPKGHPVLPKNYQRVGQPVIIPGDMGTNSYVLVGTQLALEQTFGSVCHGAGRMMSRSKASRQLDYGKVQNELKQKGIVVISRDRKGFLEEAPAAYKNVNDVVNVVHNAGLARKVARMRPLGVIKG